MRLVLQLYHVVRIPSVEIIFQKELMKFIIVTKIVLVGVPSVEITCDEDYCGLLEGGNSSKFLGMPMEISMH